MPTPSTQAEIKFHPQIQAILDRHNVVFGDLPKGLPPNRGFEHIIELEPKPAMINPYRHPRVFVM